MGKLTYGMLMSLDGFLAAPSGPLGDDVMARINTEMAKYGTEIYGRRMYETMVYWETHKPQGDGSSPREDEFARLWQGLDKLVISSTLESVSSRRTELVRAFQPDDIRQLKAASPKDISVAGPTLAAQFIDAGLVDEFALYYVPAVVGSGDPVFRHTARLDLELLEEQRFASGVLFVRYGVRKAE